MTTSPTIPTRAYDLLTVPEREAVDDYVNYAINRQNIAGQRIIHALYLPIPTEYIKRSRNALYKPLVLAAVAERIREEAVKQDISPDRVIEEHAAIAFSDIYNFFEEGEFGTLRLKGMDQLTPEQRRTVKSIEIKPGMYGISSKVVLHDKHPSLKAMGQMMGLVAPDRPPALLDYVKPPTPPQVTASKAPERAYAELLEM